MESFTNTPKGLSPPFLLKPRSSTTYILITISIALFTDLFLYGLIVPIIPFILADRLNIPHNDIQFWTSALLAAYAGTSVLFSLPAGIIADKLKTRQAPFLVGLSALFASTMLLYLGRTLPLLVLARMLQGLSAAMVWTIGLAMVMDTVGSANLGAVIGTIFSFISVGELVSPVLGGVVYEKAGNGAVFGMGFGLLGLDFLLRLFVIEKKVAARYPGFESPAIASSEDEEAGENDPLLPPESTGPQKDMGDDQEDWTMPERKGFWLTTFPLSYPLTHPRLLIAHLLTLTQAILLGVFDSTVPNEAQDLFGFNSLNAGLLFIPQVLPYLLLGPLAGAGVDRYGPKYFGTFAALFVSIPLFLLRVPHADSTPGMNPEVIKFAVLLAFSGIGLAGFSASSLVEASYIVEQYHRHNPEYFGQLGPYAQLYALNSMVFSFGLTVGPLVAGELRTRIGYGNMNAFVAGFCVVVGLLSWVWLGGKPKMLIKRSGNQN